jgi:hypothetical protein
MVALGVSGVYVFARSFLRLTPEGAGRPAGRAGRAAFLASALYAGGALPLVVASFGWGQQTAALATVPVGLAALRLGVEGRDARSLWVAGLLGMLAAGSLYLATGPLVGGAAAALAAVTAWRRWRAGGARSGGAGSRTGWPDGGGRGRGSPLQPLWRLAGIGAVAGVAGLFSHLSAAAFLLQRTSAGLLRADELAGRSTHVPTFAGPAGALGVAPLDLYRQVAALDGHPLLSWPGGAALAAAVAAAGALALLVAGIGVPLPGGGWRARLAGAPWGPRPGRASVASDPGRGGNPRAFPPRRSGRRVSPPLLAVLLVVALYEIYLRWLRPFPYGEFKLLSTVWFLVPCLVVAGAARLGRRRLPLAWLALAAYAFGLGLVEGHTLRFLSLPWGGSCPRRPWWRPAPSPGPSRPGPASTSPAS